MVLSIYGQAEFTVIAHKTRRRRFCAIGRISRMVDVDMVRKYEHVVSIESMMQSTVR